MKDYYKPDAHNVCVYAKTKTYCGDCLYVPVIFREEMSAKQYIRMIAQAKGKAFRCFEGKLEIIFACTFEDMGDGIDKPEVFEMEESYGNDEKT